mmetsp:Transcript_20594/g.42080  ORF Transcript_20594/g.42080 Transcript_20594/m.42080 type:complete len:96 (-) Transcript_20594:91-378(-)
MTSQQGKGMKDGGRARRGRSGQRDLGGEGAYEADVECAFFSFFCCYFSDVLLMNYIAVVAVIVMGGHSTRDFYVRSKYISGIRRRGREQGSEKGL